MKKKIHDLIILIIAIAWFISLAPLISCVKKMTPASSKDSSYTETVKDTTVKTSELKAQGKTSIEELLSQEKNKWFRKVDSLGQIIVSFMIDDKGDLNYKAETKPSVFNFPIKTKTFHTKETIVQSAKIEKVVPEWVWFAFGLAAMALVWMFFRK